MANGNGNGYDPLFIALSDGVRQNILKLLKDNEKMCVNDIVDAVMYFSRTTVSYHLALLRNTNLVKTEKDGRHLYYSLDKDKMAECCKNFIDDFRVAI